MKWKANKTEKKPEPKLGDRKEKIWYALIPRKCGTKWIWLEKYIAIYEWQTYYYPQETVVKSGILFETVRTETVEAEGWIVVDRKELLK